MRDRMSVFAACLICGACLVGGLIFGGLIAKAGRSDRLQNELADLRQQAPACREDWHKKEKQAVLAAAKRTRFSEAAIADQMKKARRSSRAGNETACRQEVLRVAVQTLREQKRQDVARREQQERQASRAVSPGSSRVRVRDVLTPGQMDALAVRNASKLLERYTLKELQAMSDEEVKALLSKVMKEDGWEIE